jgi:hypothetical protein
MSIFAFEKEVMIIKEEKCKAIAFNGCKCDLLDKHTGCHINNKLIYCWLDAEFVGKLQH